MDNEFYTLYKDYTNTELLKIVKQAKDYQPDAISAAEKVLGERSVSDEERELVERYFDDIEMAAAVQRQKIERYKNAVTGFLEPVLQPTGEVSPDKWLKFVLLAIGVYYVWSFYYTVIHLIHLAQYARFRYFDITDAGALFDLAYVPVVFYLLYKRSRWGWGLLFVNNLAYAAGTPVIYSVFFILDYVHHESTNRAFSMLTMPVTIELVLRIALVWYLWSQSVANYFMVSTVLKKQAVVFSGLLIAFFWAAFFLLLNK